MGELALFGRLYEKNSAKELSLELPESDKKREMLWEWELPG